MLIEHGRFGRPTQHTQDTPMNTQDFTQTINKLRLSNKGRWYTWQGIVNGQAVALKGFGPWLQLFRVNGLEQALPMQMSVKAFKAELTQAVS